MSELHNRVLYSCILASSVLFSVVQGGYVFATYLTGITVLGCLEWIALSESGISLWPGLVAMFSFGWSMVKLRQTDWWALFQLFSVVWLTDIGAYFTGRALKGPKLLQDVSPNKTWSGFIGGTVSGVVTGLLFQTPWQYALLLSWLAQIGDFLESYAKRCAGKKDSNLPGWAIPGHGGILDRIDGLLLSTPVYYAIICIN